MFEVIDCTHNCDKKAEMLDAFQGFSEHIYESFLALPTKSTMGPGMFYLDRGYNGIKSEMRYFTVAYCDLVLAIEAKMKYDSEYLQSLENRMKMSIIRAEPLSLGPVHLIRPPSKTPFKTPFKIPFKTPFSVYDLHLRPGP